MHQRLKKDADILLAGLLAALVHAAFFLYQGNFISARQLSGRTSSRHVLLRIMPSVALTTKQPSSPASHQKRKPSTVKKKRAYPEKAKALHREKASKPEERKTNIPETPPSLQNDHEQPEDKEDARFLKHEKNSVLATNSTRADNSFQPVSPITNISKGNGTLAEAVIQKLHKPLYPRYSRIHGEEGRVIIHVKISSAGKLESYEVIKSTGYPRLDKSAIKAIKKSKFAPALQTGKLVSSEKSIAIVFRLNDQ